MRIIKPFFLLRIGALESSRIGHFAGNTELYLCEQDAGINVPNQKYVDIFYFARRPICNIQLKKMWKRVLHIFPAWILEPLDTANDFIPGGQSHKILTTQHDRDVHNLLDRLPPHLAFIAEEEYEGRANLLRMGLPLNAKFVCLIVRDSAYLEHQFPGWDFNHHNYRDSDIQNYVLAAEALAERGYFVLRMGAKVHLPMNTSHPMVIDYAMNGMRNDFMDIYLGAKCEFCISVGTGYDAVPLIFRRPIAYVNVSPIGYFSTFSKKFLGIFKHYLYANSLQEMSLAEIFSCGAGFLVHTSDYCARNIVVIENTSEEIHDLIIEMYDRLNGFWVDNGNDEELQRRFWEQFPVNAKDEQDIPLHGKIYARYGAMALRNNKKWLM
jgi:putative glycosyltransferase (TIGR04372 family)